MARIKKEESLGEEWLESITPVFATIFKLSLVLSVVTMGYLLYGLLVVKISNPSLNGIDQAGFQVIVGNLKTVGLVCLISTSVFALALTLAYYENKDMVVYVGALGAFLYFGLPYLMGRLIVAQNGSQNPGTDAILGSLQGAGKFVVIVAAIRGAIAAVDWIRAGPTLKKPSVGVADKEKASIVKQRKMTAFSPCWNLPYCRDSIKEKCPAYLARKRCWKFGRGCYCDEEMIQAIVSGLDGGGADSYALRATTGVTRPRPSKPKRKGKPPCAKCYIYQEHQNLKHKLLSNFMLPAAILICVVLYKPYTAAYAVALQHGRQWWQRMAFSTHMEKSALPHYKGEWGGGSHVSEGDRLIAQRDAEIQKRFDRWTMVFVLAMLATFVLVYLSKLLEFFIFKLNW